MQIPFCKYHGTGNDFIVVDNRREILSKDDYLLIEKLCHRRFGIGADGLILLEKQEGYDFGMTYFNADGKESSMCGNGGRCIVAFAKRLGIIEGACRFLAIDGAHEALIKGADYVELKMQNVHHIEQGDGAYIMDTGSPHYVVFVEDLNDIDVVENGQAIRYSAPFREKGINVNFVETDKAGNLQVATYERGVEAETFSCGTGVVASALAYYLGHIPDFTKVSIQTKGGYLEVHFSPTVDGFEDIWLCGEATFVFEGMVHPEEVHH